MYQVDRLLASAARTTTGEGAAIGDRQRGRQERVLVIEADVRAYISVTAASGTNPTLDVDIVAVINGIDFVLASFTQLTAAGIETINIANCPESIKAVFTIGGTTPSFTFEVHTSR